MAVETRHAEKNVLFDLLMIQRNKTDWEKTPDTVKMTIKLATQRFIAIMEPEDVKLVQKAIMEID